MINNRVIKFRQQNKNNGQWHYWGWVNGVWINPKTSDNYQRPEESQQFIGLSDKNCKDIYEGDFVLSPRWNYLYSKKRKQHNVLHVVYYKTNTTPTVGGDPVNTGACFGTEPVEDDRGFSLIDWSAFYQCEVIGNIYENPELLGGAK